MKKRIDWLSHQNSIKIPHIARKGVPLIFKHLTLKKSLKTLLQNIYLMLELFYHKRNPLIMTRLLYMVAYFKTLFKTTT